ncbi:glycosyltransferase [Acinetobacter wanghuae]|uniref:glycosyltransferase n=1 Tax=Acinetobacter wanghuae TaxID=2662362 RepID=UPI003AF4DA7F
MDKDTKMRFLHIIASVDMSEGGPIQAIVQNLEELPSDQSLEIVSLDSPEAEYVQNFKGIVHALGPAKGNYRYTPKLKEWIQSNAHNYDAAVIHGLWNHASIGGWQGCRAANLPYVLFTHGMLDPWFKQQYPIKHVKKQIFWLVQGKVLRDASYVLFTCEEEQRLAQGVFYGYSKYNSRVVAFGAPDVPIFEEDVKTAFRNVIPELGDSPYLLFLSRIHEKKGCDLLIKAFAAIEKRDSLKLVIAGPCHDDLILKLKKLATELNIDDRIYWPGMLRGAEKAGAFIGAEAFVLTSHQENFGIAIAEALAYGKPVLITDKINIWREIKNGKAGIVGTDTVNSAISILQQWENMDFDLKVEMSNAARAVYEKKFTVKAAIEDLTNYLANSIK